MPVVGNEVAADVDGVVADVVGTKLGEADEFEHPVHAGSVPVGEGAWLDDGGHLVQRRLERPVGIHRRDLRPPACLNT